MFRGASALILLFILSSISLATAAKPTSFCKCTCWSNSTIIKLGPPESANQLDFRDELFTHPKFDDSATTLNTRTASIASADKNEKGDHRARTCNDCNRRFCLDQNLPKCKGATEEDVFTTCFQRDSGKDKAVVIIFIIATTSLLVWAAVKPCAERWIQRLKERRSYLPLQSQEDR
ncbi:hypothetical protein FQN57_005556 [Myotisia sp. PD_48]|nr:hypothetical protein FQN57_005556 [Myotisia sp. PD_48]